MPKTISVFPWCALLKAKEIKKRYGYITDYISPQGHKWFDGREKGTWTDDTQLSLVVAESLIANKGIDIDDIAKRHIAALQEGDLGWGGSTRDAIKKLISGVHWSESGIPDKPNRGMGNGVVMKIAPLVAYFASRKNIQENSYLLDNADYQKIGELTAITHKTEMAYTSAFAHIFTTWYCLKTDPEEFFSRNFAIRAFVGSSVGVNNFTDSEQYENLDSLPQRFAGLIYEYESPHLLSEADIIKMYDGGTSYVYNSLPFSYAFF
ncbi:MAG: ADP-ribosylglycohydrolase family protein [Parcubacteria group bacterium]|nr:ADP-ribosylglycohydrolase family protein [Parcubacteria group bacterium]